MDFVHMTNSDGAWIMATVISFPIAKLAEGDERPFAAIDADIAHTGGAKVIALADRRPAHAIRHTGKGE